jgi:tetratricopeptide (TPR) repeat protein
MVAIAFYNRGVLYSRQQQRDKALADFDEAARLDPDDADAHREAAWIQATASDAKLRDGKRALVSAEKACALTKNKDPWALATLAAAYAETGDFAKAVEWQTKAVELAGTDDKANFMNMLSNLKKKMPLRVRD